MRPIQHSVQDIACDLILRNPSMSNAEIASLVRARLPTCNCGKNSISWYKSKLKRGEINSHSSANYQRSAPEVGPRVKIGWPNFGQISNEELLQLAELTTRHICFLHPDIVRSVVEDNERHRERWSLRFKEVGVDSSLYIWQNSPCAFPGVRRYAGSGEIAIYRGQKKMDARPPNALALDDNTYPKQIWSFIFRAKKFANQGPLGYSLAHLIDHKHYKNRATDEFDSSDIAQSKSTHFGLYTCPTNTVYMPSGLMRPTDFSFALRNLVQRKAEALYGNFCNLWPPHLSLKNSRADEWSTDRFSWREPVGTLEYVQPFLTFRNEIMEELIESANGKVF